MARRAKVAEAAPKPADVRAGAMRALLELASSGKRLALAPDQERVLRAHLASGHGFVALAAVFCAPNPQGITQAELIGHLWRLALDL